MDLYECYLVKEVNKWQKKAIRENDIQVRWMEKNIAEELLRALESYRKLKWSWED